MTRRSRRDAALLAGIALLFPSVGCEGDPSEPGPGAPATPTAELDTSRAGFTEFSGVTLPEESVADPRITAEYDESGTPEYRVRFTGTPEEAAMVCEQIGNWLPRSQGVPEEDRERFGIDTAAVEAAGGDVRGCEAVDQETGVQTEGIVLYPDEETARVHLLAYDLADRR